MLCPRDKVLLISRSVENIEFYICGSCQGLWLSKGTLKRIKDREETKQLAVQTYPSLQNESLKRPVIQCPFDVSDMAIKKYQSIFYDHCIHCGGVWLDGGELYEILKVRPAVKDVTMMETIETIGRPIEAAHLVFYLAGLIADL